MGRIFADRLLAMLLTMGLLLVPFALSEESAESEAWVEEIGEVDLLSPDIYDEAEEDLNPAEEEPEPEAPAEPAPAPEEAAPAAEEAVAAAPAAFQTALTLGVKEQAALNGTQLSGGATVTYVSSKPKLVNVDANGLLTARKKGAAIITVYQGEAALGTCTVTVKKAPKKVTFPDKAIVMSKGQSRAYPAALPKGCAGAIRYETDNPGVLAVDAAGNLTGVSGGSATVTATAYNGRKASCAVRVLGGPAPTWVKLNPTTLQLPVKGTAQLAVSFDEGRDAIVTYTTSNKKLVTVNDQGLVTAKKAGQATITATTHNGLTATCTVQMFIAPKKVTLNAKKIKLHINDGFQLVATLTKNSVSEITWASDNEGVATVDENGLVAAVAAGTANITVRTTNGKKAKCKVTVEAGEVDGIRGKVLFHEESDTLKVTITDDSGVILTYIWAENPVRQLFKHYGNAKPSAILQDAVNRNGLQDRIVVGFNASPPVNETYRTDWNRDPKYRHREPSPLMIANGEVLVNDPNKTIEEKYLYWLDGNSQLRHSMKPLENMTVEERSALYRSVIDSGARNTMIWQPVLISEYRPVQLSAEFLKHRGGNQRKHALCQMDTHNFIVVSSTDSGKMTYPAFQKYLTRLGCRTAVEFDAGGSTSLLWKGRRSATVEKVTGCGRSLTMVMYFTE